MMMLVMREVSKFQCILEEYQTKDKILLLQWFPLILNLSDSSLLAPGNLKTLKNECIYYYKVVDQRSLFFKISIKVPIQFL
jgi:hypothetical protein